MIYRMKFIYPDGTVIKGKKDHNEWFNSLGFNSAPNIPLSKGR